MSATILWIWEKTGFADSTDKKREEDKSEGMNPSRLSLHTIKNRLRLDEVLESVIVSVNSLGHSMNIREGNIFNETTRKSHPLIMPS